MKASARLSALLLVAWACALAAPPARAAEKPVLRAEREVSPLEDTRPSEPVVRVVLAALDKDDVEGLDECLAAWEKRGDYAFLFRAARIEAGASHTLWFVRPAPESDCPVLYGPRRFVYFWVEERRSVSPPRYRVLHWNGADSFAVYARQSHGLNDIEVTDCIASGCHTIRMAFDGRRYRQVGCAVAVQDDEGRRVMRRERCGSDE